MGLVEGRAKLLRDDYCDGLGNCLPVCPTGAITFEEREAAAYDEAAVLALQEARPGKKVLPCGCPGTQARAIERHSGIGKETSESEVPGAVSVSGTTLSGVSSGTCQMSELCQWPVQIKLVPVNASYFNCAHLLVSADCAAYAYGNFHSDFIKNKITLIGCPKLDEGDYSEKLTAILKENDIKSVTVVRMEVPCCGGIEQAVKNALQASGKFIPWQIVTISLDGKILE